jgi:hypothetical protein
MQKKPDFWGKSGFYLHNIYQPHPIFTPIPSLYPHIWSHLSRRKKKQQEENKK